MAQKIVLVDDLDGSNADETLTFSVDGVEYEIDLSKKHAKELRAAVAPYVDVARPLRQANGVPKSRKPARSVNGKRDGRVVREWAKTQGIAVPDRGRIPKSVEEQFAEAHD